MSGPAFVRDGGNAGNTTSLFVPFSDAGSATKGDLLAACVNYNSNFQTPSVTGWTPLGSIIIAGVRSLALFSTIAAGGELGVTFNLGTAAACSGSVAEWSGAKAGTVTSGAFVSTHTTGTFGPSDAPVSPDAVPQMFLGLAGTTTATISTPWVLGTQSGGSALSLTAHEPAPNAAASGTLTNSSGSMNAAWMNLWLEPSGGSANTATITGTLGALGCAATVSASLVAAIASSIGANAADVALSGHQAIAASASFGPLSSNLTITAVGGLNTASITGAYGALASTGSTESVVSIAASGAMGPLAARGTSGAQLAAAIASSLGAVDSAGQIASFGTAQVDAAIGPLASAIVVNLIAATLPPNPCFYLAMPYRCWYAAMPARSFYISECC